MPNQHLPYVAVSGLLPDRALVAISERRNIDAYIATGALRPHHMRLLASMPSSTRSVLRRAANCSGTDPAGAIDFCASASAARILLQASNDPKVFKLYNQYQFRHGRDLHDDRRGADRFRNKTRVFAVLCERVLYGGDVLPPHVLFWFNQNGRRLLDDDIDNRGCDRSEMRKCYTVYRVQKAAATVGEGIVNTTPYEFMLAYQRYQKFFPVVMRVYLVCKKQGASKKILDDMGKKGFSSKEIMEVARGQEAIHDTEASSPEGKKRAKKLGKAISKDSRIEQLVDVVDFACKAPKLVTKLIMEYL